MSVLSQPMISITGAQHLTFDGLTLDTGRNMAIKVKSSQFITIKNSVIRNFSLAGILLNGENISAEFINGYFFEFLSLTCFSKKITIMNQGSYEA